MTRQLEKQVNWRTARNVFRSPTMVMSSMRPAEPTADPICIFLPYEKGFDVVALRDWLHDPDNNNDGFKLNGCFDQDHRGKTRFTGLKLTFNTMVDAVFFRLAWASGSASC